MSAAADAAHARQTYDLAQRELDRTRERLANMIAAGRDPTDALHALLSMHVGTFVMLLTEVGTWPPSTDIKHMAHEMVEIMWGIKSQKAGQGS